jgi:class 3 adenylate cyclase
VLAVGSWLEQQRQKNFPIPIIVFVTEISRVELASALDQPAAPLETEDRIFLIEKDFEKLRELLLYNLPEPEETTTPAKEKHEESPQEKTDKKPPEQQSEREGKDEAAEEAPPSTQILLADDSRPVRSFVTKILKEKGYTVHTFENGKLLLDFLQREKTGDIILLDNQMPEMDGITTLKALKADEELKELPVLFLSALTDKETVVKALELGADDYMEKPFNNNEFLARINVHVRIDLLKKRVLQEKEKSDRLLLNTLPKKIVQDLKTWGSTEPETFPEVTVFFSDIVGFTSHSSQLKPGHLISELNDIFTEFDNIMERNHCERIKTIGDAYLAVCGMPQANPDHAKNIVQAAQEILEYVEARNRNSQETWQIRIGIHSGPVVGGIVGIKKYIYDIFGDTINTASRMESNSQPMRINVSRATYELTSHLFAYEDRPPAEVKGKGLMRMYFLHRDSADSSPHPLERQQGLRQAKELFYNGDYRAALDVLEQTAYDTEGDAPVHQLTGSLHYKLGDYDQCHHHWQKALMLDPDNRKLQQNLERLNSKLALGPKD